MDDVTEQPPAEIPTGEQTVLAAPVKPPKTAKEATRVKKKGSFVRELPFLILIAFVLAMVIKQFLIQAFYIPSVSMTNTLQVGDRVLVNKLVYRFRDIHRGEIVVFDGKDSFSPEHFVRPPRNALEKVTRKVGSLLGTGSPDEKDFIKRVMGLPGDTISCCDERGRVVVNGTSLDEPYLFEDDRQPFGPVRVPEGRIFVMGDHRSRSSDSRAHISDANHGTVPIDDVIGRAFVIIWPPDNAKGLRVPSELEKDIGKQGMPSAPWSVTALPPVLGLAGALPVTALRRRLRRR